MKAAVADVVPHTAAEKPWLLGNDSQIAAVPRRIKLCQIIAVDQHLAVCRHIIGAAAARAAISPMLNSCK